MAVEPRHRLLAAAGEDTNGDGRLDIITAPGPGNPPDVRALDFFGPTDIFRLQAFDPGFLGGVFVAGTHP